MKKKSYTKQLLEFLEDLTEGLDNVKDLDIVHLDLCKAFVRVLLKDMGIWNQRTNTPFLSGRTSTGSIE